MPFTPSHAVLALPFLRTPLVPAAIAIGAMTPDLALFVRWTPLTYRITHDPAWIAVTGSVALLLFLVWRVLLRPAVREFLPARVAARLPGEWAIGGLPALREAIMPAAHDGRFGDLRWRPLYPAFLAGSLILGVATHIGWDAFTHEDRWGTALIPALGQLWGPMLGVKWLQHGSSVLGLLVLGVAAVIWFVRTPRRADAARRVPTMLRLLWWLALPVALVLAWTIGFAADGPLDDEFTVAHLAYRVLPPACAVWGALSCVAAAALLLLRHRPRG